MLDDPVARQRFAAEIVRDSKPKKLKKADQDADPFDVMAPWSRENRVMAKNARVNFPLRDVIELRRHLAMAEETIHELRLQLVQRRSHESQLILARGTLRQLNQRINAYRFPAPD